jgi:hypothetical protein
MFDWIFSNREAFLGNYVHSIDSGTITLVDLFPDVRLDLLEPRGVPGELCGDRAEPSGGQNSPGGTQPVHHCLKCESNTYKPCLPEYSYQ